MRMTLFGIIRSKVRHSVVFRVICLSLVFSLSFPHPLFANPEGATVAAGQASIDAQGSKLNVRQSTQKAVIDWRSFNIGQNEHTQFYQPNSKSIALNRINQGSPSQIGGKLSANGRLILVNPDGVFFSGSSSVDVAGLIATTAGISNSDFMSGKMNFGIAGNPEAAVINEGRMTARDAGLVGFVAPHVENRGVIEARLGAVQLSSGETFVMDMAGDGIIGVAIEKDRLQKQLAKNSGRISADGGSVQLTAAAARSHVNSLVTNTGTIEAKSVGKRNGKIVLSAAGSHGSLKTGASKVTNEGRLAVSGKKKNERGGDVQLLGDKVELSGTSRIDASGFSGGGRVYAGGDYQGGGALQHAFETVVAEQSKINVSALGSGHAGKAIIWSDLDTYFKGDILATGGRYSGDGGFVEVSGKRYLDFQGAVDTTASKGNTGMLLLDPTDIVISSAANSNVNGATPFSPTADDIVSNLNVTTLQTALASTNVTVQTRATGSQQGNITVSDPIAWSANRTLTLDAHNNITVNAAITARNTLTFNAGGDVILNANLIEDVGGASLVFQPKTLSNSIGIAGGAGTLDLSTSDLGYIQSGFNAITIGAAAGTGNINANAYTWNAPLILRTSGAGIINIDGAQNVGIGNNDMTLTSRNVNINAALTGGSIGALTIQPDAAAVTVGIGDGQAGTLNLTNAELANITDGWGAIVLGNTSGTSAMNVGAYTWNDDVDLRSATGAININGMQTMGVNDLAFTTGNLNIGADLSGTGALTIQPDAAAVTVGIGDGQAGTLNLTNAELTRILDGWSNINFGRTNATGAMNVGAYTWNDDVDLRSTTGAININGMQTMGVNDLTFATRNLNIGADLSGTGALVIASNSPAVTTGIGDGQAGTLNLTNAELARILDGWTSISFGITNATDAMNVGAYTWNDDVVLRSGTGAININGAQNMGMNNLTIQTRNVNLASPLNGSGTLTIQPDDNINSMGVGSAATGALLLSDAALNQISDGWGLLQFGRTTSTAALNIASRTWNDSVCFRSGTGLMTVLGDQNLGANDMTFSTDSSLALNGNLSGSGTLRFWQKDSATTIGLAGGAGTLNIDATELGRIQDGWSLIRFGNETMNNTGAVNINAYNFLDSIHVYTDTGAITFDGAIDVGANNLTVTSRAGVNINAALSGTGTLSFVPEASNTTVGLAGGAGSLNLSAASLDNISDGWSQLLIGRNDNTSAMQINAYNNWRDNVKFMIGDDIITVAGAQNYAANDVVFETDRMTVNAAMTGTGNLSIAQATAATTMGLAGAAGTLSLTTAELNNISDGWNSITLGRTDSTGLLSLNAHTWNDDLVLRAGSGNMTIAGAQNLGANNLTIQTNGDPAINAALTGTGVLAFEGGIPATTIGLAGGAGTLALTAAELNNITNGWSDIYFGGADGTGAITADAYSGWNDHVTFRSDTGGITIAGIQNFGPNNFTLLTNADPSINAALSGTGTLSFRPAATSTSMGFGGGIGTYNLGAPEISNIQDGWSQIIAGRSDLAADLDIGTSVWNDPVHFLTSADILLNGTVTSTEASGTSLVLASTAGDFINNAGASAIDPGGGRYLIYSASPANNTLGGLTGFSKLYNKTYAGYGPGGVVESGNVHLFSIAPTLTVTADDISREYGLANSLTATITGFIDGDTAATAVTGSAGLTTPGGIGSDVGSYSITAAIGSLASAMGYQFTTFVDGLLDITPAPLTVIAEDKQRQQGQANPAFTALISGFRNGDTESVLSGLDFSTLATPSSAAGNYAITPFGITAMNYYASSYVDGNLEVTALSSQGGGSLPSVVEAAYLPSYAGTESIQTNIFNTINEIFQETVSEEEPDTTGQENENEPVDEAKNQESEKNDPGSEFIKNNIKGLVIQAGIFSIKDNAVSLAKKLSPIGNVFIQETSIGEKKAWRVGVGPFSNKSLIDSVFSRVQNLVRSSIFVVNLDGHSGS